MGRNGKAKRPPRDRGNGYGGEARKCPCGKNWYPTLEAARAARWRIGAVRPQGSAKYYRCKYGSFHWTRKGVPEAVRVDGAPRWVNASFAPGHYATLEEAKAARELLEPHALVTYYECKHHGYHWTDKGQPPRQECTILEEAQDDDDDTTDDEDA